MRALDFSVSMTRKPTREKIGKIEAFIYLMFCNND